MAVTWATAASILRPGIEVDADHADAEQRLALDVLDVVDRGGQHALVDEDDALLDLVGGHAGVLPDDADDRDVDLREDVRGHAVDATRRRARRSAGPPPRRCRCGAGPVERSTWLINLGVRRSSPTPQEQLTPAAWDVVDAASRSWPRLRTTSVSVFQISSSRSSEDPKTPYLSAMGYAASVNSAANVSRRTSLIVLCRVFVIHRQTLSRLLGLRLREPLIDKSGRGRPSKVRRARSLPLRPRSGLNS